MQQFQPVRAAVTIGLIVTMMIQPMVVFAAVAKVDQPARVASSDAPGCGCCEVASSKEACCCCGPREDSAGTSHNESSRGPDNGSDGSCNRSLGACLCGMSFPPMDRGDRGSERNVVRYSTPVDVISDDGYALSDRRGPVRQERIDANIPAPRFSQRFLCVWRI